MPPTDGSSQQHFRTFAREVYGYQKTLVWLVSSSFVISGVTSFANASTHSTSQIAMVTLVGTIAGCSAVTATYLSWVRQPDEEYSHLIMFDPTRFAARIQVRFLLSLSALIIYSAVPAGAALSLIFDAVGMYFFFNALATGALAARDTGRQEALWHASSSAQRQAWLDERFRRRREARERVEFFKESENFDKIVKAREATRTKNVREHRRRLRIVKLRQYVSKVHHWSVGLRLWIDPRQRLLSVRERLAVYEEEIQLKRLHERLLESFDREAYERIQLNKMRSVRDERTGLDYFRDGGRRYLLIESDLDEEHTHHLLTRLANGTEEDVKLAGVTFFMMGQTTMTDQASALLAEREVKFYWPSEWTKADAPATPGGSSG